MKTILLIEDDENDVLFFRRALNRLDKSYALQVAEDGRAAIDYLKRTGAPQRSSQFPSIIITDGDMPGLSGIDFLKWLKSEPSFQIAPIIVLSGSASPAAVREAYGTIGVHSYIVKPHNIEDLEGMLKRILDYWSMCELPN